MKPTETFKSLFSAHPRSNKMKSVTGNLKKPPACRTITMQFTEDQIERMERECAEMEIQRNKYVSVALDHYWNCKKR